MIVITALAIGVIGLSIGDQAAPATQSPAEHRVVSEKESRFEEELNRAATDGYRVVHGDAGVQVAILERSSDGERRQSAVLEKPGSSGKSAAPAIADVIKRGDIVAVTRWSKGRVKGQVAAVTGCSVLLRTSSTMLEIGAADIKTIRRYQPPKVNPGARTILSIAEQCDQVGCVPAALAYVGVAALFQGIQDLSRRPTIVYRGRRTPATQGAGCGPA